MLNRQRPPAVDAIPSKPVAAALTEYGKAEKLRVDAVRDYEQAVREGDKARGADHQAVVAALDAGRPVPAPVHERENREKVEVAQRVRDARTELAGAAWATFLEQWDAHREEMLLAIEKADARDRKEQEAAVDRLEDVMGRRTARAGLLTELGGKVTPADWLVVPADRLPVVDGPGRGYVLAANAVAALRDLGLPPAPVITNPDQIRHRPLSEQGVVGTIGAPGFPSD
jgi:hypothetical protein